MARATVRITSKVEKVIEDFYAETPEQIQEILDDDPEMWDSDLIDAATVEILDFKGDKPEPHDDVE